MKDTIFFFQGRQQWGRMTMILNWMERLLQRHTGEHTSSDKWKIFGLCVLWAEEDLRVEGKKRNSRCQSKHNPFAPCLVCDFYDIC